MNKDFNLQALPTWYDGKHINEVQFCEQFLADRQLKFIDSTFYSIDGIVPEQHIEKQITDRLIAANISRGISNKGTNLLNALKRISYVESLNISPDEIHISNGVLHTDGTFSQEKRFCKNRLNVNYNSEAESPVVWHNFISALLEPDDILTLQEFMGYCLVNSTRAQAMLFLIGNGGEGKSRIGVVMYHIFQNAAYFGSINELAADKFLKANLIGKSVLIDDDMSLEGLKDTSFLKSLATSETPLTVQAKRSQGIQVMLSVRTICFSNGSPRSLYDKTDGWSRRLIILSAKPVPPNRIADCFLSEKLIAEKEGIFLWMFEGLQRLLSNNFKFMQSEKAVQNATDLKEDNCNIISFLKDIQFIKFDVAFECSTAELYRCYCFWCTLNSLRALRIESFQNWLRQNHEKYGLEYNDHVMNREGRKARGYRGITIV